MEEFKKIVALAFVEAYKKYPLVTSKTALSKKISEAITEKEEGEAGDKHYKSLVNYYDYFFNEGKKQEPTEIMINKLLSFLNYDTFEQFTKNQPCDTEYLDNVPFVLVEEPESKDSEDDDINSNSPEDSAGDNIISDPPPEIEEENNDDWVRKIIIIISITLSILILIYLGYNRDQKDCMIWSENQYIKTPCDAKGISVSYNPDLIDTFKKINNDTITNFFGAGGKPLYWYSKKNNTVELFTKSG